VLIYRENKQTKKGKVLTIIVVLKMVQFIRAILILVIPVFSVSGYAKSADRAVDDIYRDSPSVFISETNPIDLKFEKKSNGIEYEDR
jgi:flagellar basal body-associated protein FliL